MSRSNSKGVMTGSAEEGAGSIEWEIWPKAMLVQKRDPNAAVVNWAPEYLCKLKLASLLIDPELKAHNSDELLALCKIANECLLAKDHKPLSVRKVDFCRLRMKTLQTLCNI